MTATAPSKSNYFYGLFLIALSTLTLQILLMRLMSVVTWYHLAFFAISVAMMGMTAGAVTVYLRPKQYSGKALSGSLAWACIGYALAIPLMLYVVCTLPLDVASNAVIWVTSAIVTLSCVMPFYFSGVAVTATLTRSGLPINRIYAADLAGASLGCAAVLLLLNVADVPSLILFCSALGFLSGLLFIGQSPDGRQVRLICIAGAVAFTGLATYNANNEKGWRPVLVKGIVEGSEPVLLRQWNSFSRVMVQHPRESAPAYWGASPLAPQNMIPQMRMNIDGDAGTTMRPYRTRSDIEHLGFDVTNIGYRLGRTGTACVIGVGGGRDVQAALLFGHTKVVGVELNPIFINLLQGSAAEFSGIGRNPAVTLVTDEARSYLARTPLACSVLQMSLIDTWAATGAGAFSMSENGLYTVEGWRVMLSRLAPNGVFMVSRWYNKTNLGETGRLASLAVASLLDRGVADPQQHLIMVTADRISTLLVSNDPFSAADVARVREAAKELQFNVAFAPDQPAEHTLLRQLVAARSLSDLAAVNEASRLNFAPPRDDSPYFFNMLKLRNAADAFILPTGEDNPFMAQEQGVARGNLVATAVLISLLTCLAAFVVLTVLLPLWLAKRKGVFQPTDGLWQGAVYFSMIGAGFMFAEIALIQRLSVFLGHPVYGLGVLLFSLIAATGVGSYLSGRIELTRPGRLTVFPLVLIGLLLAYPAVATVVMREMTAASMLTKSLVSLLMTIPLGVVMGFFYPTGMKVVERLGKAQTPWYWALNGVFGTMVSGLAVFISIYFSITHNFILGAACYAVAAVFLRIMARMPAATTEAVAWAAPPPLVPAGAD